MPALGERVLLRGSGQWWSGQTFEAYVVDIGTGEKADTVKVQYADGGYKRFKTKEFEGLVVADDGHETGFGTKDYEWADDQYNPAGELNSELEQLRHDITECVKKKDFLGAEKLKNRMIERRQHQNQLRMEQCNLVSAVKRENYTLAHEIQQKIDKLIQQKQAEKAQKKDGDGQKSFKEIMDQAMGRAFRGGLAGMGAMVIQVVSFMWLRTTMNYQYRYGGSAKEALRALYKDGGIPRFYRGLAPALITGPLSRFGDTASNVGMLAFLDSTPSTKDLPTGIKTMAASGAAACFRVFTTPIDTVKTTMQVEGKEGISKLRTKMGKGGPLVLYHGALGNMTASFAGHYPWFFTFNTLQENVPMPAGFGMKLLRNACIGWSASIVSDCTSNSIRVLKVYRQTSEVPISYAKAAADIIAKDGVQGLFLRGLGTRIFTNGAQGMVFSVLWKFFESKLNEK